jgi:hypothetical protein
MSSIWTRLLFLHGHVTHKNLAWRADTQTRRAKRKPLVKAHQSVVARCAAVWPRLIGPR